MKFLTFAILALSVGAAVASPITNTRQLTFEGKRAGEGYYSADGSAMIFQSERDEANPFYKMFLMDLETGDVDQVSPDLGKTTCGWIHPAGDRVMFASTQFDPEAKAKMQEELDFRESGQTRRYSWDYDPEFEIVERDLDSGEYRRLSDALGYDAEGAYSPDGSRIIFASNRHAYVDGADVDAEKLAREPSFYLDIYVMNADGTNVQRLTTSPGYDGGPFWSADGSRVTWRRFSEDGATAEIFTMAPDGSDQRQLTDMGVMSWAPFFHPSGDYLIFSTNLNGFANFELYLVDAAGERVPVRVSDRAGFDGLPNFTPDGAQISWTSNATPLKQSQIFVGDWDHAAALALLEASPKREGAAGPVDETSPKITVDDLKRHVYALADDAMEGRLTGTPGEQLATQYVADAFAGLGLKPAGDNGWFQEFEFTSGVALGDDNALSISVDGEARALELNTDWRPLAFSRVGEAEKAAAIFAGYGIDAPAEGEQAALDSFADLDLTGKWAVIWRGMPEAADEDRQTYLLRFADMRYKAAAAKARGAVGVILTPSPSFEAPLPRLSYEAISGDAGLPVVAVNADAGARMLAIFGDDLAGMTEQIEAGKAAGRDLIGVNVEGAVALNFETKKGRNVLARLGLDSDLPPVVIGGHVDHLGRGETSGSLASVAQRGQVHNGADDNASGVAGLIEAAQKLAADHAKGKLKPKRDVVFAAWSGEELGLLGASHYVKSLGGEDGVADLVSVYLNMDMVGRMRDKVVVGGVGSSPVWARELERRNAVVGLPIVVSNDNYAPTDTTAFYLGGAPILGFFTGVHGDYHKPSDTADKLNYEGLRDITRLVALIARSRAKDAEEPEYIKTARKTETARRRGKVFLGTIPDYAGGDVEGVAISGVVKDGPAEVAGLLGGDVIVGLAGKDVANIYDFVRALNGLKAGEEIDIVVTRDGEKTPLRIIPGLRE
ncbi:MAG: M20/M25/M40 family metallo-hydrolase [Pikeienuella sp.]